jgi:hypothetical protein
MIQRCIRLIAGRQRIAAAAVIVVAIVGWTSGAVRAAQSPDSSLLDLFVFGPHAAYIELTDYPIAVRRVLQNYLKRAESDKSPFRSAAFNGLTGGTREMVEGAWIRYERKLSAWSSDRGARRLAVQYVEELRPCYEWEGYPDCPEHEAQFAADYLASHPGGPFSEFLPLLAAHRWLCAAEGYVYLRNANDERRAREEHAAMLARARRSSDPLVRIAAEALASRNTCRSN